MRNFIVSDQRFHPKAIDVFIGKRSRFSGDTGHKIGSVKTVIAIIRKRPVENQAALENVTGHPSS
jgi:hypothetical protein